MDYSKASKVYYCGPCGNYELFTGEARIASFFDNIGEPWERPEWYDVGRAVKYRPDFYLPRLKLFVEVKNLNPDDLLSDRVGVDKMAMFYEKGYDLYCVDGMPVTDAAFAYEKYKDSFGIFFSNKFIHQTSPLKGSMHDAFTLFNKDANSERLNLVNATARTSIDFLAEARSAKNRTFGANCPLPDNRSIERFRWDEVEEEPF